MMELVAIMILTIIPAAYVTGETCGPKVEGCKDARIREFFTENGKTRLTGVNQSAQILEPRVILFQLNFTKSSAASEVECKGELQIDLTSARNVLGITGFYLQTCSTNGGQFLHETKEWKPVNCAYSQDSVVSKSLFPARARVSVFLSTLCTNKAIHFRYFVQDDSNHLHGPFTQEYLSHEPESLIAAELHRDEEQRQLDLHERVKRATTGHLVVGNRLYVHQLSLDGTRMQAIISGQTFASIVDFHFRQGHLYWTDRSENRIMRSNLDGSMKTVLLDEGIGLPEGLGVDWISDKLYWADFTNRQLSVLDLNTGLHKELLSTGSNSNLRGVTVDPIQRMIFWTDWHSSSPKIERASMDGTNRTVLHSTGLTLPYAITLDYAPQVVYWADQSHDRIESSNYDGSNRRVLISTGLQRPFDITVFGDMLYWSDLNIGVLTANKSGSQAVSTLYGESEFCPNFFPFGIQVISESRQPQALNPCGNNNGGCSDFCLLSSSQSSNYSCACPDGMVLQSDMQTCAFPSPDVTQEPPMSTAQGSCSAAGYQTTCCDPTMSTCEGSPGGTCYCDAKCHLLGDCCSDVPQICSTLQDVGPYIVFSNVRYIHLLSLDGSRTRTVRSGLSNVIGIDYHFRMNYMFWTDINTDEIWRSQLNGTDTRLLLGTGLRTPEDIAVDWISGKLYWTDNGLDTISVMSIDGGFYTTVVNTGANTIPRSIAVDPLNRRMYWTDRGSVPKIEGASMDGTNRTVIHSTNLVFPDGITLDQSTQTLYWVDFQRDVIESSRVDGTARTTVVTRNIFQPFGLTQYGGIIYYTDWLVGVGSANATSQQSSTLFNSVCERAYGIEVVSVDRQPTAPNPCETNNGGCSHLCLLSSTNSSGYSCKCVAPFYLDTDQRTCIHPDVTPDTPVTTPSPPGSCVAANYTTCCRSGLCRGYPPDCFCNIQCVSFRDCCGDFYQICNPNIDEIRISGNVTTILTQETIAQFQCTVSASSIPTIQWTFTSDIITTQGEQQLTDTIGSLDVKHSIEIPASNERSSILTINNVLFADAGVYNCFADIDGNRLESSASLTVVVPPTTPLLTANNNEVRESEVLQLVCKVSVYPVASISWVKTSATEGTAIFNGGRTQIIAANFIENDNPFTTSTLTVVDIRVTDGGNYQCEASNGIVGYPSVSAATTVTVVATNECLINNQLCLNGGTCVDYPSGYGCICTDSFSGSNCQQETTTGGPDTPIIIDPPANNLNTTIATAVNLTCTAEGHPAPRYEWYRDGELLPGERRFYLYIPEALPGHRGNYTCKAINNLGETESVPASLDIPGVFQYVASVELHLTANQSEVLQEVLGIIGLTNSDTTIYSIEVLNTTRENAMFLITLLINSSTTATARTFVYNEFESSGSVATVLSLIRHDGCEVEFDDFNYMWSEATIGDVVYGPCPCSEFLPEGLNDADMAVRTCLGSIRGGGMWRTTDYSQCVTVVNELSQGLCNDLMNLMMLPVEVSKSIVQRTSQPQNLSAVDVASATEAVVRLTEQAIVNPEVRDNYLRIIDNIQMADMETVTESQSSSRLLGSLGHFLDEVQIPQNATSNQTTLTYQTYAIQIQDVDPDTFNGQTLNVDLGSVKEALNLEGEIDDDALMTSETAMNVLMNATGTIQTPESLLSYCSQRTMSSDNAGPQRLSYSVFLTDVLFQSINESLRIGSLILAARFNCGANATLMPPITVTLQTNTEIEKNASNSTCAMWDSNDRFGAWSTDGCREIVRGDNKRVCECTQVAHFGILFDLNPQPLPPDAALALSVVTYIGSVLSLICLTLFIITYLAVKKLRTSIHGKILVNMSLALMGLYISFLIGGSRHVTPVAILCGFIAAFLNYFMLVFFAWTSAEAVWLYLKLVKVIGISQYESKFVPVSMPTVWFIPLLIIAVSAGAGHRYYTGPFYCRATEWPFWFALVLPFLLMYIFDWIMFILIMGSICKSRNIVHTQPATKEHSISPTILKQNLLIAVVLSSTFALGWGFGLLATSHSVVAISIVFQALFSIFVGAQGVLIFCFHGIRNKDVRALWKTCFKTVLKQPRKVYNIAHSVSQERNLTASPSTNSYGFSSDTTNKTDVHSGYENNPTFTTSTMQGVDTKVNVAYGHFASTAATDSEGVYEIPGSEMTTNQAYGQTSRVTAAIENDGYYEDIAGGSNAVYETIPT